MNKFYIFFLCTILTHVSFGQDSLKAQTGSWATELNINPFNGGELSLNNALNQIKVRRFLSNNTVLRLGVTLSSKREKSETSYPYGTYPYSTLSKRSTSTVGLNLGFEKHLQGTKRLSPYWGAEFAIALKSSKQTFDDNGSEGTIKNAWQTVTYSGGYGTITYSEVGYFKYGINLIAGFDFYVARNLFVGYELAFSISKTAYKDIEITNMYNSSDDPDTEDTNTDIGPTLINGVRIGFVF
jgi:hypothetical protein